MSCEWIIDVWKCTELDVFEGLELRAYVLLALMCKRRREALFGVTEALHICAAWEASLEG